MRNLLSLRSFHSGASQLPPSFPATPRHQSTPPLQFTLATEAPRSAKYDNGRALIRNAALEIQDCRWTLSLTLSLQGLGLGLMHSTEVEARIQNLSWFLLSFHGSATFLPCRDRQMSATALLKITGEEQRLKAIEETLMHHSRASLFVTAQVQGKRTPKRLAEDSAPYLDLYFPTASS